MCLKYIFQVFNLKDKSYFEKLECLTILKIDFEVDFKQILSKEFK